MTATAKVLPLFGLLAVACSSADPPSTPGTRPPVVELTAPASLVVPIGGTAELAVTVKIADGFHIQANPPSQPYLIPAVLEVEAGDGAEPGPPVYPPGIPYRLQGADEDLSTYAGSFPITVPISARPDARPGERRLRGTLRYQACDARMCFAPSTIAFEVRLRVVP